MKVEIRKTIKYGSGKYLYVGEVYDLASDIPDEVRNVIMRAIDDHRNLVRTSGIMIPVPEEPEEPDDNAESESGEEPEDVAEAGVQPATETKSRPLTSRNKR